MLLTGSKANHEFRQGTEHNHSESDHLAMGTDLKPNSEAKKSASTVSGAPFFAGQTHFSLRSSALFYGMVGPFWFPPLLWEFGILPYFASVQKCWKNAYFSPNSFSYGVFANIGSGAVHRGGFRTTGYGKVLEIPGRFRGSSGRGFREGSGQGFKEFLASSGRVPRGRFLTTGSAMFRAGFQGVPGGFRGRFLFPEQGSGKVLGQVRVPCGASSDQGGSGSGAGSGQGSKQVAGGFRGGPGKNALKTIWLVLLILVWIVVMTDDRCNPVRT